jgi:hypothetical protein
MKALILAAMVAASGCSGRSISGTQQNVGPTADQLETAFYSCWEQIGKMERETRPVITWTTCAVAGGYCDEATVDPDGNATIVWHGKLSYDPGFPSVLAKYRNWLRYSSWTTHPDEQDAFEQSFVEGLTSIGL